MLDNLADLFNELKNRQTPLSPDLPVYGDHDRSNPEGVWSWDCEREIVGTCLDDLEIVPRRDETTKAETKFEYDASGQGHCWKNMVAEDHPAEIVEELECWEIEDNPGDGDTYTASNGITYRLA